MECNQRSQLEQETLKHKRVYNLMDFPFIITKLRDLSARNAIPAYLRAVAHLSRSDSVPDTEDDTKLIPSINALIKGRETLFEVMKLGAEVTRVYSIMIFMPARKRIMESVQPAKIPLKCWCQLLGANSEKDLLYIPT